MAGVLIEVARVSEVLSRPASPAETWLGAGERERLSRLHVPGRRDQFLAGRWLLRELLSQENGGSPSDWSVLESVGKAPQVIGGPTRLRVSISHSGLWVAVAVADAEVGVDLEQRPRRLDTAVEPLLLNAGEPAGSLSADELLRRWVAKEAWLKARGGPALPEQLRRLQLRQVATEAPSIRLLTHPDFFLALAAPIVTAPRWRGLAHAWDTLSFDVSEVATG